MRSNTLEYIRKIQMRSNTLEFIRKVRMRSNTRILYIRKVQMRSNTLEFIRMVRMRSNTLESIRIYWNSVKTVRTDRPKLRSDIGSELTCIPAVTKRLAIPESSMLRDLVSCFNLPIRVFFFFVSGVAGMTADSLRVESVDNLKITIKLPINYLLTRRKLSRSPIEAGVTIRATAAILVRRIIGIIVLFYGWWFIIYWKMADYHASKTKQD